MTEWTKVPPWKGGEGQPSVGSNPTPSATWESGVIGNMTVSKTVVLGSSPRALAIKIKLD